MSAKIVAVCVSQNKGERKTPVESVDLLPDHGIIGDGHAGNWHRQVSLLAQLRIGRAQVEVTQIGKECHTRCAI